VTLLGALGSRLEERLTRRVQDSRLVLDTRNATGARGDFRHVIKI
jgi:hypothetical protein